MKQKIYIILTICFLGLTFFNASVNETNAQPPRKDGKANDAAKKLVVQGDAFYKQKDYRSAINKYAEAVAIAPNYSQAHFMKGNAHFLLNEFEETVAELDTALEQGFTPIKIYETRWEAHSKLKNYDAALSDVKSALQINPASNYFVVSLGDVSRLRGDFKEAIAAYSQALPSSPNRGNLYYYIAFSHYNLNETSAQSMAANEALKNGTSYPGESYVLIGDAFQKNKQPTEAIQAFERALYINPETPQVYLPLSSLYQSQNRLNDATILIKKGIKLYPDNGEMHVNLTWFYSLADRNAEAVNFGQQAVKLLPENHAAHTNLCRAYNDLKQFTQALNACNKALTLKADDGETYLYLARINDSQNKKVVAKQYYKKAVTGLLVTTANEPENSDALYLLGNAYYYDDQLDKAIEAYQRSLALNANFPKAVLNLGYAYIITNKADLAREQYNILLKMNRASAEKLKLQLDKL